MVENHGQIKIINQNSQIYESKPK